MTKADMITAIFAGIMAILASLGLGWGWLQNRKYKNEREEKVSKLMEGARELAKTQSRSKSVDELVDDSNKRFGPAVADKSEKK